VRAPAGSTEIRGDALDPTTFAVIFNALDSVVEEMSLTFEYSAWSSIIAEARDFSCAVYDSGEAPNALCVFDALPIHVNAQPVAIGHVARFFGADAIYDGDVMLVNSSYYGGTHIGDLVVACPVFWEGEHLFWAAATGHHMDVGSAWNTSVPVYAADIWSEGLQIPPIKLEEKGVLRPDVLNLFLENVRYRDFVYGDLMSQVGSVKTARRRLLEFVERWGAETLKSFASEVVTYADRRTRDEIALWPDGTYAGEAWVDSDGHGNRNMRVACKMTIAGTEVSLDFEGSDPQVRSGVNTGWATCQNAASIPILCCLDADIPHNQGCLDHIAVSAPSGTIVNAEWPAATAAATIVPADAISDAVWKCLAQAIPAKAVAGCGHITPNCVTTGIDRRTPGREKPFTMILFNGGSGGGACAEHDGWPFMVCEGGLGGLKFVPIEVIELHYPLVVREYEVRQDSMGAGRTRGGPGLSFLVTPSGTGQIDNYGYGDGMLNPPFGLFGGKPGDGGALYRVNGDGTRSFFNAFAYFRFSEGETWCAISTGGGGYGDPLERDPVKVFDDVRDGFVSARSARDDYGVDLDERTFAVDLDATTRLRLQIASDRTLEAIVPMVPDAGTYYQTLMRPGDSFAIDPHPPADADSTL
jgi:N-methylhydantoinase B